MLRVWVCAAHMGGILGPELSKQGPLFRQIFHKMDGLSGNLQKLAKNGSFSDKIYLKSGYDSKFR